MSDEKKKRRRWGRQNREDDYYPEEGSGFEDDDWDDEYDNVPDERALYPQEADDDDEYDDYEDRQYTRSTFISPRSYIASDDDIDMYEEDEREYEERDYRPIRFRRDGKLGLLGGFMYALFIISVSVILACVAWMAASDVLALNKPELTSVVEIPKSAVIGTVVIDDKTVDVVDIDEVADALKDAGIIEYKFLFKLFAKISNADTKIKPGAYSLSTTLDYRALVKNMQIASGAQLTTKVTIPEGYTMAQIFETLEENDICKAADLWEAAANKEYIFSFLEDDNIVKGDKLRFEGYLFPDTYEFYQGEQAAAVLLRFLTTFHYKLTADMDAKAESLGITLRQAVIIASMIEREAADMEKEGPVIASVIYNRIRAGMPLGIDATIQYFLPEHKAVLTYADTQIDNPYNTYLYTGLPPGPICNPGIAAINAALNPNQTGYYYYALNMETGEHEFFTNLRDHEAFKNTQNYG